MDITCDPESLTPAERSDEVASILARDYGITSATPVSVGGLGRSMLVSNGSDQETWTEHPRMSQGDLVLYAPVQYTSVLDGQGEPVMYQEISNRGWRVVL